MNPKPINPKIAYIVKNAENPTECAICGKRIERLQVYITSDSPLNDDDDSFSYPIGEGCFRKIFGLSLSEYQIQQDEQRSLELQIKEEKERLEKIRMFQEVESELWQKLNEYTEENYNAVALSLLEYLLKFGRLSEPQINLAKNLKPASEFISLSGINFAKSAIPFLQYCRVNKFDAPILRSLDVQTDKSLTLKQFDLLVKIYHKYEKSMNAKDPEFKKQLDNWLKELGY